MKLALTLAANRIRVHPLEPPGAAFYAGSWRRLPGHDAIEYTLWRRPGDPGAPAGTWTHQGTTTAELRAELEQRIASRGVWWQPPGRQGELFFSGQGELFTI